MATVMITDLISDQTFSNLLTLLFPPLPLRERKVRFTYPSICHYADEGTVFTQMPLDNSF